MRSKWLFSNFALACAIASAGCNAILGNEDHAVASESDAPDGPSTLASEAGAVSGEPDAAGDDARSDSGRVPDASLEATVASEAGSAQPTPGTQPAPSPDAATIQTSCTTDGGECKPATPCYSGALTCEDGGEACAATTPVADGTPCGTGSMNFCSKGVCNACEAGADCSSPSTPCVVSTYDCSTGVAVCAFSRNAAEGTTCGANMYCTAGVCEACKVGAACAPASSPCHVGKVSACTNGVATCTDTDVAAMDGTSCTSGATTGVCSAGSCAACTANAPCNPGGNPCQNGLMTCSSGPACRFVSNVQDRTPEPACGANQVCLSGACAVACDAASCAGCCNGSTCVSPASETTLLCGNGTAGAACGACPFGSCIDGSCQCPPGTLDCGGVCASCATPPAGGTSTCSATTCTFTCTAAGTTKCGNACLTFENDSNNCGSCGNACGAGTTCSGTTCVCNGSSGCAGCCSSATTCEPYASETSASCGASGAACASCGTNGACSGAGVCGCTASFASCGGACVDTANDAGNCGRCGHSCEGGACTGGVCQPVTIAASVYFPTGLALTSTSVYWTESQDFQNVALNGSVEVAPLAGGSYTVVASQQNGAAAIAANSNGVFWTTQSDFATMPPLTGGLMWLANGSTSPIRLSGTYDSPVALALTGTNVYWADATTAPSAETLLTLPLTTLTAAAVPTAASTTTACVLAMVPSTTTLFMMTSGCFAESGLVLSSTLSPLGNPTDVLQSGTFLSGPYGQARIAIDSKNVYMAQSGTGTTAIVSVPIGGGPLTVRAMATAPGGVAVDADNIYWTDAGNETATGGSVFSIPLAGGTVTTVASGQNVPYDIGLTTGSVYWTNMSSNGSGPGSVMMVAKP